MMTDMSCESNHYYPVASKYGSCTAKDFLEFSHQFNFLLVFTAQIYFFHISFPVEKNGNKLKGPEVTSVVYLFPNGDRYGEFQYCIKFPHFTF